MKTINQLASKLIQQHQVLEAVGSKKAITAWKNNWSNLVSELDHIKSNPAYLEALKGHEASIKKVEMFNCSIRDNYELNEGKRTCSTQPVAH